MRETTVVLNDWLRVVILKPLQLTRLKLKSAGNFDLEEPLIQYHWGQNFSGPLAIATLVLDVFDV